MATGKELPSVQLTRKYGSMPMLAQKLMISLEYKDEGFTPRRISGLPDPPKTGNKQNKTQETRPELALVGRSSETPAKNVRGSSFRRESSWCSSLLERRQTTTKTPNMEKTAAGSAGKRRHEDVKFPESRHSEWLRRISAFNDRISTNAKTRGQNKEQTTNFNKGQQMKGVKARKTPFQGKEDIQKKTVPANKNSGLYSQALSLEREFYFKDYRQKCIQWLKSLPGSGMEPMTLR